jgi:hypothetical protein
LADGFALRSPFGAFVTGGFDARLPDWNGSLTPPRDPAEDAGLA